MLTGVNATNSFIEPETITSFKEVIYPFHLQMLLWDPFQMLVVWLQNLFIFKDLVIYFGGGGERERASTCMCTVA